MEGQRFPRNELGAILAICLVLVAVLAPWAHEKARRMNCYNDLSTIGPILCTYAADFDGYYPNDHANGSTDFQPMETLKYIQNGKIWSCPSRQGLRTLASNASYRYIGSGLKDDNQLAETVSLAYDMSGNHPHNAWMNVTCIDGHTEGAKPGTVTANGAVFSND